MMRKVILFFALCCVVMCVGSAQALTTSSTVNSSTNPNWFLPNGTDPDSLDYYRAYNQDWGWTHTVTFAIEQPITILGATLSVEAWDVDLEGDGFPEEDQIRVGATSNSTGVSLGNLQDGDNAWSTTLFTLDEDALEQLVVVDETGTMKVWMNISALEPYDSFHSPYWFVTLKSATLSVDYEATPIPAPAAMVLASLGAGVVGWLRKRRTL